VKEYQRHQFSEIQSRLAEPPKRLIAISGPRQTGKTTLIRQVLKAEGIKGRYVAVDTPSSERIRSTDHRREETAMLTDIRDERWLTRVWEEARQEAEGARHGYVLVLDEIQKIPQWSETVKGLWDADRAEDSTLNVVVLGSAPLLMQKGLTESLAGRFELIRVNHWSFREMFDAFGFDLDTYVYFGGYPGAAHLVFDQKRWRSYIRSSLIEPNIDRDILAMTRVNKPALLKRAFELGCGYSGQILSYTKMQGQLQDAGNTTTLAHYLDLLSNAGLLTGLPKFAGAKHRQRASSPKLNVLNNCFMAVNSGYTFEEAKADRTFWGRLVESCVGAHLFNTGSPDIRLYYWRNGPHEVDFVLQKGQRLVGIEVKSSRQHDSAAGLAEFDRLYEPERVLLVGQRGIPLEEFLVQPASNWFESAK